MQTQKDFDNVIEFFKQLSSIPRQSGKEHKVCDWLKEFAIENGFEYLELPADGAAPNVLIKVAATKGFEDYPVFCLQAHTDMVCQKTPESTHDFDTDPLELVFDGDWLIAKDTTLGADNGVGVAMAMAAACSDRHGRLELLFTTDEEQGLGGVASLPQNLLEAKYLLNLDSEDDGFIIGCAGGQRFKIQSQCEKGDVAGGNFYKVKIGGLIGGHSGVDIDKGRLNAIKVCGRLLEAVNDSYGLLISSIKGGNQTNVIARDSEAVFSTQASLEQLQNIGFSVYNDLSSGISPDKSLKIEITKSDRLPASLAVDTAAIIMLIKTLDSGVVSYCKDFKRIVETSTNIGIINFDAQTGDFSLEGAERSSQVQGLLQISDKNRLTAEKLGFRYVAGGKYLPWQPNPNSKLLAACSKIYSELFSRKGRVEVVHAGLECGVIGEKYPDMDMISFGPLIENAHSPKERVSISSIKSTYRLLKAIITAKIV